MPLLCVALAASAEAIGPTVITRVDDLIDAPRALFGRTRAQVEGTLGAPLAVRQRALPSLLHPEVVETIRELAYDGARIGVSASTALRRVEVYFRDHRVYRIEWNYWTE